MNPEVPMNRLWRNYGLSVALALLFLVSWGLQTWVGWVEFKAHQQTHGEPGNILGPNGYLWRWGHSTLQNWQAEFLHLVAVVVLTTFLVRRGSRALKGSEEELRQRLDRIEQQLTELYRLQQSARPPSSVAPSTPRTPRGQPPHRTT
ncbi:MAG: hypothetical protein M3442_04105 [Chloroflexota bacterium]|nr:hypothetical protein [Chloroflexota bacterium]